MTKPTFTHYIAAPGVLEGPYAELKLGEVTIQIWTRRGEKRRIDGKIHGKRAREAAEQKPAHAPNPCLVPLDVENEGMPGGPFVFALVKDGRMKPA
jgi:hypothetical protein